MKIPWTNLNNKASVIRLKGIYLLLGPKGKHDVCFLSLEAEF